MLIVKISILVNCINGGVKITKRMTILVLLLIFAILSISSVSANDVDNNLAIDENSLSSSDMVSLDDSYNPESDSQNSDILETGDASEQLSDDETDAGDDHRPEPGQIAERKIRHMIDVVDQILRYFLSLRWFQARV